MLRKITSRTIKTLQIQLSRKATRKNTRGLTGFELFIGLSKPKTTQLIFRPKVGTKIRTI